MPGITVRINVLYASTTISHQSCDVVRLPQNRIKLIPPIAFAELYDNGADDDDDGDKTWWDKVVDFFVQYWFYIALVLLLIVLLISYNAIGNAIVKKLEKTIREGKKPSLFAETFLQLLWSSKYDRLVGYKRGKQK